MKKRFLYILIFISGFAFSQQKENLKLGFFSSLQADVGLDLAGIIREKKDPSIYYFEQNKYPTYFTYGFTGQVGYQPLNWFAMAAGLRYSYITPKFHNVYWMVQPYFFVSNPQDREFRYITASFGRQLNTTHGLSDGGFMGLGVGGFGLISERVAQKVQFNLDVHSADYAVWFLGVSYGITIFSNKNL